MKVIEVTVNANERLKVGLYVLDLSMDDNIFAMMTGTDTFIIVTSNESGMAWIKVNLPVVFDEEYSIKELK